ncbi:MAG TPA: DUF2341 domain-containing protein [Methylomirabilota bacterium]|nr:DUF2341 domain-containing protein [Methylomirabilota bacterium]
MRIRSLIGTVVATFALAQSAALAQNYPNAVLALNPAGYWPLSENTTPPFGYYIATNSGTAGAAANGYYQTWYQGNGTGFYATNNIVHAAGATGDGDLSMQCNGAPGGLGQYVIFPRATNGVANPAVAIQAPFTIELWVKSGNTNLGLEPIITEGRNPVQLDPNVGATNTYVGFSLGQFKNFFYWQVYDARANGNGSVPECDSAPILPNTWYHIVGVFDGTNISIYANGVQNSTTKAVSANYLGQRYVVDPVSPLLIGTGTQFPALNGGINYLGGIDEVAVYPAALSLTQIAAHYGAGSGSSYASTVLADAPSIYLRLNEPALTTYPDPSTYPVAANLGTVGAAANGRYQPGTAPGVPGPAFSGFGGSSLAVAFNSFYGAVDVGGGALPAVFNPTGTNNAFTVTTWFKGYPADAPGRFQVLVGHSDRSWRLSMDGGTAASPAGNRFNPGNGPELSFANTADVVTNGFRFNDGQWHMAAGVFDGTNDFLYLDGVLAKSGGPVGSIVGTNLDLILGGDPQYTTPSANAATIRNFDGALAHAAFFTNALSAVQIQQLYGAAGVPPTLLQQPQGATNNAGASVSLSVVARGSAPLVYQWYRNNALLPSGTAATLVFNPAAEGNSGSYYAVVTNSFGSVTSAIVQVLIFGPPVVQQQSLTAFEVFAGTSPTLAVTASGAPPLGYQWSRNGSPVTGATASTFTVTNIQANGTFTCVVSNAISTTPITPIAITVLADPTAPYPLAVLADKPIAYYRLDETSGDIAHDHAGGYNGFFTNVVLSQAAYDANFNPQTDPNDFSAGFGLVSATDNYVANPPSYLNFGASNGTSANFSIEAWVNGGFNAQQTDAGIVTLGYGNGGEEFNLDVSGTGRPFRFFVRDAAGGAHLINTTNAPSDGNWHHVVGVCDQSNGKVYLYVDGLARGTATITSGTGILPPTRPVSIGSRQSGSGTPFDNQFVGNIDEVALYKVALSSNQVANHYLAAGIAPQIAQQPPLSVVTNEGATVNITVAVIGTAPLAYQWYDPNNNPIAGGTGPTLVLHNVNPAMNGGYVVIVTNPYGNIQSMESVLTVNAGPPILEVDLQPPFAMGYAGLVSSYSVVVDGTSPFSYRWTLNGSTIAGATNSTYSFNRLPGTNLYAVIVTNANGSVPSSTVTNVGVPIPTLNPANYTYKMKVSFSGYNRGETLVNFPALVRFGTNLPNFSFSQAASPTGGDLRFTDASGTNEIPHEVDEWNNNGYGSAWVQLPQLASTNDFIWAYWGNPAATIPEAWSTNGEVWLPRFTPESGYQVVYHLKEGALPFADGTVQHPATNGVAPAAAAGIVGTGGSFDGTSWLDAGTNDLGDAFTLSSWMNMPTPVNPNIQTVWANQHGGFGAPGFALFVNTFNANDGKIDLATGIGNATGGERTTAAGTVSFSQWHLLEAAVNRTNATVSFYVDGLPVAAVAGSVQSGFTNVEDLNLGRFVDGAFGMHAVLDEARVQRGNSSSNWVWADYMTVAQNNSLESYSAIVSSAVTLTFTVSGGNLILTWPQGTLQSAASVTGTYGDLPSATSPYTVPLTGPQQFYRVRVR